MPDYFIGLMSGTSMDGIDAALVEFDDQHIKLIASHSHRIPPSLKEKLKLLTLDSPSASLDMLGEADSELGSVFADATNTLLKLANMQANQITAIGSHGQTIRHRPDLDHSFTMQIGDANKISYLTGITTVADFRRKDMAAGGEGAPLAPAFHQQAFHSSEENRAVLNIGGIANLTYLPSQIENPDAQSCFGFDTGPGNTLMDAWIQRHKNKNYDNNGMWSASAEADPVLVKNLLHDPFISSEPPKSTGREHYHIDWLEKQLSNFTHLDTGQVQASLCQFTCDSIIYAVKKFLPPISSLIVCGGGAHNANLMNHLSEKLPKTRVSTSDDFGIHPDWVEAIAFAWLARQTINKQPGNLPAVTGAKQPVVLGAVYLP